MTHFNNAVASYRMYIRCTVNRSNYEAENYYQLARRSAALHADQIGTTRYAVMMDVIDHHSANRIYS